MSGRDRAGVHRGPILRDGGPPSTRWLLTDASFLDGNVLERATISPARSGGLRRSRHREPSTQGRGHGDPAPRGVEHETRVARSSRLARAPTRVVVSQETCAGALPPWQRAPNLLPGGSDASRTRTRRLGAEPQSHREESENVGSDLITHRAAPSRASSSDRRRDPRRGESHRTRKRSFHRTRKRSFAGGTRSGSWVRPPFHEGRREAILVSGPERSSIFIEARDGRETTGTREAIESNRPDEAEPGHGRQGLETRSAQRRREASSASLPQSHARSGSRPDQGTRFHSRDWAVVGRTHLWFADLRVSRGTGGPPADLVTRAPMHRDGCVLTEEVGRRSLRGGRARGGGVAKGCARRRPWGHTRSLRFTRHA